MEPRIKNNRKTKGNFLWMPVLLLGLMFTSFKGDASSIPPGPSTVNFNELPKPGQDAYWIHNPKNPTQKILLVPSAHQLNLRFIKAEIATAMKFARILIVENAETGGRRSWDDSTMVRALFETALPPLDVLKRAGILRDPKTNQPFNFPSHLDTSWIDSTLVQSPGFQETRDFLLKNFEPLLGGVSIGYFHPHIVRWLLKTVDQNKINNMGMDGQIARFFALENRTVLGLETLAEGSPLPTENELSKIASIPVKLDMLTDIQTLVADMKLIDELAPKSFLEQMESTLKQIDEYYKFQKEAVVTSDISARNQLWLPRLLKHLKAHEQQSIVIVVGSIHFPGDQGILKLLADQGFTFTKF